MIYVVDRISDKILGIYIMVGFEEVVAWMIDWGKEIAGLEGPKSSQ